MLFLDYKFESLNDFNKNSLSEPKDLGSMLLLHAYALNENTIYFVPLLVLTDSLSTSNLMLYFIIVQPPPPPPPTTTRRPPPPPTTTTTTRRPPPPPPTGLYQTPTIFNPIPLRVSTRQCVCDSSV